MNPLFVVDQPGGQLAHLLKNMQVHALSLVDLGLSTAVEQWASRSVDALQRVQPHGPYRLLGNGSAGLVAYEMASQLMGRDEVVEFLGVVECRRPLNQPGAVTAVDRYCVPLLPIPTHLFTRGLTPTVSAAWQALLGNSLRVVDIGARDLAGAVESALASCPARPSLGDSGYSPLMTLQAGERWTKPMFFVPGAGASVTAFMPLVDALGTEVTVQGLQPRGLGTFMVPHSTVEAAAAAYLREIQRACPKGPYYLAGHSFGGWIALEIAYCLLAAGKTVADPIVLIDSDAPAAAYSDSKHWGRIDALLKLIAILEESSGKEMALRRTELEALDYETQLVRLMEGMKTLGVLPRNGTVQSVRDLIRVFSVNINTRYVPRAPYPGKVVLIQAAEPSKTRDCDDDVDAATTRAAWREHATHLECLEMPGNHMTLLKPNNVGGIAALLQNRWRNLESGGELRPMKAGNA